nr:MAG: ORF1 [Torque teno midi virus]
MPFWWNRRRKPWWGRWRRRWKYKPNKRRRRRFTRRRNRRTARRGRRRRRYRRKIKVRRKKPQIVLKQWQPDSIVKCRIKGYGLLVLGAEGRQYRCYTPNKNLYTPPKSPSGGGFGVEKFSLKYLYEEYKFYNNIWTATNINKDLCRYLYVKFIFYRHKHTDFLVSYDRQPPFDLKQSTYTDLHPQRMLLQKHKKIILSQKTKPNGKLTKRMLVKPPKQMINKWFFTDEFSKYTLLLLQAVACDFNYSHLGAKAQNQQVSIIYINRQYYSKVGWYDNNYNLNSIAKEKYYWYVSNNRMVSFQLSSVITNNKGITYDNGWFNPKILQTVKITNTNNITDVEAQAVLPTAVSRYNPNADTGKGNTVWLVSVHNTSDKQPTDPVLYYQGLPLYYLLHGWLDYVIAMKNDKTYLDSYYLVIQSPAIHPYAQVGTMNYFIPIDMNFWQGKAPFEEYLTDRMKSLWMPTLKHQVQTINAIVECSAFIPKYSETVESNWELKYDYNFYFKWGGPQVTEKPVQDPTKTGHYDVPDKLKEIIQIENPEKQKTESILHAWDFRRGYVTNTALKRMYDNLRSDSDDQSVTVTEGSSPKIPRIGAALENPQNKEKEMHQCLQTLFKKDFFQEAQEETDLKQLILQQQQKQHELKYNILQLIAQIKQQQRDLQLQTGLPP